MRKVIVALIFGLVALSAQGQSQEKKDRLLVAVQAVGSSCEKVESYADVGKDMHINYSNGIKYALTKGSNGYELKVRK